jgi:putative hemolysin
MGSPLFLSITLVILVILSAIFSGTEAAYISLNKVRLRHLIEKKKRGAEHVYRLVSHMDELITAILICNNLVNTAIATITAVMFVGILGPERGVLVSTLVATIVLLVVCETTPKIYATNHPELVTFAFRHPIQLLVSFFRPVVKISTMISNRIIKFGGGKPRSRTPLVTEEEIKLMIRVGKEEGYYADSERKMLERIFHFDEVEVMDVMTPFEKMVSIDVNICDDDLANLLMEEGHNRIPVFEGNPQNIIGILYVHDLLYLYRNNKLVKLRDLLSAPFEVSPTKKVSILMREFQNKKIKIAIVRAQNNRVMGLVTLEDLIEEIVGEIEEVTPI